MKESNPDESKKITEASKWAADMIKHLWNIQYAMWCNRCTIAHGSEEKRKITLNAENIDDKLREQYRSLPPRRLMNPSEKRVFKTPLKTALSLKIGPKIRLFTRNKIILDSYEAQPALAGSAQNMRNFLLRDPANQQPTTPDDAATATNMSDTRNND